MDMSLVRRLKPYVDDDVYRCFMKMVVRGGTRVFYLLDFGNGSYGALWRPAIIPEALEEIVIRSINGDEISNYSGNNRFITGLCYTGKSKDDVIDFITKETIKEKRACGYE